MVLFWKPLEPKNWTVSAVLTREAKRSWPILLGFGVAFVILSRIPFSEEDKKTSKYYQQISGKHDSHTNKH
eukprot:TRINITY_DN2380_c0_g1_i1.p1 TRINITY_DN2380_c0_g1~~TRINITY_DN2380_c0_g1_i1.p1  ORF type:complete len:71 (-),score=10.59 TRINITY_DN2380_c0_g1_i1:190-402(-)